MFGPCYLPVAHTDIPHLAVALGRAGRYIHSAILYRCDEHTRIAALDFDLEGNVQSHDPAIQFPRYVWAIPQLHPLILKQVAAFCESIAEKRRRFTYQFAFNENVKLKRQGEEFVIEGGNEGFTCATFILAIFQTLDKPLVKLGTWKIRPEDEAWQSETLNLLRRHQTSLRLPDEALNRRAGEIPCLRVSPGDVLGACRAGNHPTECEPARKAGDEALRWLDSMLSMVGQPHS